MPQNISVTGAEPLGPVSAPSIGDPRDSGPIRNIVQKLLNMMAGVQQAASPTGAVMPYAGSAAPSGWLLCAGQQVSRADYSTLFGVIGTTYGPGNGTTTFTLPDLRGRFPLGAGSGTSLTARARGDVGGEESHALTVQELPAHHHSAPTSKGGGFESPTGSFEVPSSTSLASDYDFGKAALTDNTGGNAAHNTMPPFLALTYIIRS